VRTSEIERCDLYQKRIGSVDENKEIIYGLKQMQSECNITSEPNPWAFIFSVNHT